MQKTHFYFSILFFLFFSSGFSQKEVSVKVIPQNIMHPFIPTVPLEIEYKFGRIGIEYNHGFKLNRIISGSGNDIGRQNAHYFRSRLGLKYYFTNTGRVKQSTSLNLSYTPISYQRYDNVYAVNSVWYRYDFSSIVMRHYKAAIVYSVKILVFKEFDIELMGGLGAKFRHNRHYNTTGLRRDIYEIGNENRNQNSANNDNEHPNAFSENPGSEFVPYFVTNVKLSFRIFNSKSYKPTQE